MFTQNNNNNFSVFFDNKVKSQEQVVSLIEESISDGAKGVTLFLACKYICKYEILDKYLQTVNIPISGAVFPEVIFGDKYYQDAVIVIVWKTEMEVETFNNISDSSSELYQQSSTTEDEYHNEDIACLVFVDSKTKSAEEALDALYYRSENDYQYAGAGAGCSFDEQHPCIISNDGMLEDALQTIKLPLYQENTVSYGWTVLSGPHLVTSSVKNKISSLDYLPIEEQYHKFIQKSVSEDISNLSIKDLIAKYPIGIYHYDEDMIVRDPFEFREGAIEFFGDIPEFSNIYILTAKPQQLIEEAQLSFNSFNNSMTKCENSITLLFSCLGRRNFMGANSNVELSKAVDELNTKHTVIGSSSFGEIATNEAGLLRLHTMSLVVSSMYL